MPNSHDGPTEGTYTIVIYYWESGRIQQQVDASDDIDNIINRYWNVNKIFRSVQNQK